jgi:hypothetical protein
MGFSVECPCGLQISVDASQAGSTVVCECKRTVGVPSLGKLRESVGMDTYEAGAIETIRRLCSTGALPPGKTCAISGKVTDDVCPISVYVVRQFEHVKERKPSWALLFLAGPLLALLFWPSKTRVMPVEGSETVVETPLRLLRSYHPRVRRWRQARLRRLLETVPIYAQLLAEHPRGVVFVDVEDLS